MEIERKWMVTNWPDEKNFPLTETYQMDQGYISVRPTVRIRREALQGGRTALVLCFKGAGTLSLGDYLSDECTGKPGSSMGDYWQQTRLGG